MNKQEAIDKLKKESWEYYDSTAPVIETKTVIKIINQIYEPKKPVLSKEEAEWFEGLKKSLTNPSKNNLIYFITRQGWGYLFEYTDRFEETKHVLNPELYRSKSCKDDLKERLLNAVLYGYTVEPEKLYTAKLKSTGEYLHYDIETDKIHHFFAYGNTAKSSEDYHFTKDTLIHYNAWGNNDYEVDEVEE